MSQILSATAIKVRPGNPLTSDVSDCLVQSDSRSDTSKEIELYESIVRDPRYFQFARIPDRIIQCLKLCGTNCEGKRIRESLLAFYLFIGVVDDETECAQLEIGEKILKRLANQLSCIDDETKTSRAQFMTEILKQHFNPTTHSQILGKFRRLHRANVAERKALTRRPYIKQRKLVGSLTAEISYLLIRDYLFGDSSRVCRLMKDVGAVGCLVDSIFDARADKQAGVLSFRPTFPDYLVLCAQTLLHGMKVTLKHPRLIPFFLEAMRDNFYDRRRSLVS